MQSETVEQEPPVRRADIDDYDQLIIFVKFIVNGFLFRGACRQNGGVGEQTFAIFDSSLQS